MRRGRSGSPATVSIVRSPDNGERKTAGGLLIPATAIPAPRRLSWGDVEQIGPDVRVAKEGDRVLFLPSSALEVELDGDEFVLLRERDVQAVSSKPASSEGTGARAVPLRSGARSQPATKLSRIVRSSFSRFGSTSTTDCHVPSCRCPSTTGSVSDDGTKTGSRWSPP